jgi:hypothetical protein
MFQATSPSHVSVAVVSYEGQLDIKRLAYGSPAIRNFFFVYLHIHLFWWEYRTIPVDPSDDAGLIRMALTI